MVTTNGTIEVSYSDNSHIFGMPIRILEGVIGEMDIPKGGRSLWGEKVDFLERAGIEMHLNYVNKGG